MSSKYARLMDKNFIKNMLCVCTLTLINKKTAYYKAYRRSLILIGKNQCGICTKKHMKIHNKINKI